MKAMLVASRAATTAASYASAVRQFVAFVAASALRLGIPGGSPGSDAASIRELIAYPLIVGAYLNELKRRGLSAASAEVHLSALRAAASDIFGEPPPWSEAVRQCIVGFGRGGPAARPLRPGVDRALLERMVAFVNSGQFRHPHDAPVLCAIFTLAFAGCMRASEYLVSSDGAKTLRLLDAIFPAHAPGAIATLEVTLKKTKSNQAGPAEVVSLKEWPGSPVCPVRAMSRYLRVRPLGVIATAPLFSLARAPGVALTGRLFNQVLRAVLRDMGVPNPQAFSAHSFRIGAATQAAVGGATAAEVMALGRWRSDAFMVYLRAPALAGWASAAQSHLQRDAV